LAFPVEAEVEQFIVGHFYVSRIDVPVVTVSRDVVVVAHFFLLLEFADATTANLNSQAEPVEACAQRLAAHTSDAEKEQPRVANSLPLVSQLLRELYEVRSVH